MFLQPDQKSSNFLKYHVLVSFKNKACSHGKKNMLKKQHVPIKTMFHGKTIADFL